MKSFLLLTILFLAFCTPTLSQSMPKNYMTPPIKYEGSEIVSINVKTTPETIKKLVPQPLLPTTDNVISVNIGIQKIPPMYNYLEMYIVIPVTTMEKQGQYAVLLYLDQSPAIVGGRETWGYPKIDAEMQFLKKEGKVSATISRHNTKLLELSATLTDPFEQVATEALSWSFMVKEIPSADGSNTPALLRLNSARIRNAKVYNTQQCENLQFNLYHSKMHFMSDIPIVEILSATCSLMDFTLDYGEIEYDYLKKPIKPQKYYNQTQGKESN